MFVPKSARVILCLREKKAKRKVFCLDGASKHQKPGRIANISTMKKGVSKRWKPMNTQEWRWRRLSNTVGNYDIQVKHRTDYLDGKVLRNNRRPHGHSRPPELWGVHE